METAIVDWQLRCSRRSEDAPAGLEDGLLDARVPGDVTDDLIRQGLAEDISYADNCLRYRWIPRCEWTYTTTLSLTEQQLKSDLIYLEFGGIDTFAEIRLNGRLLRESANMFLPCRADLQNEGRVGENLLEVKILPTEEVMQSYENERYAGAFTNLPQSRISARAHPHVGGDHLLSDVNLLGAPAGVFGLFRGPAPHCRAAGRRGRGAGTDRGISRAGEL